MVNHYFLSFSFSIYRIRVLTKIHTCAFQMNVVNLHSSCTMMLLGILASTTIIGFTSSTPLSSYERRDLSADRPKVFLLVDQRIPELEVRFLGRDSNSEIIIVRETYCDFGQIHTRKKKAGRINA